jgi:hypothetical protein
MYTEYPHKKIHHRIYHLNNRDLAVVFGVIGGMIIGVYGVFFATFTNVPVLGSAIGHGIWFKFGVIILSGGVFGNLLSYVGNCIDIFTNHKTIFDLLKLKVST